MWVTGDDGTAGPVYHLLEFKNVSGRPCSMYGYPGVSAVGRGGRQLGSPAERSDILPQRPRLVILRRGATAHAILGTTDPGFIGPSACPKASATGLRVYPPNGTASAIVRYRFLACGKKGPRFLSVTAVMAGAGPLF
jgi:hypothetical protein